MCSVVVGTPRWSGSGVGPATASIGRLAGRVLALIACTVAVLCGWSVVSEPDTRPVAAVVLCVFSLLTVDLATAPAQARHAAVAGLGLALSWSVADPTSAGGVFPGEVALPCALLTCAVVFAPVRAVVWIAVWSGLSAVVLVATDDSALLRLEGLGLQVGMTVAAGTISAVLHRTVSQTDAAQEAIVAELTAQAVLAEKRQALGEVTEVLHGTVSDALRAVRDGYFAEDETREICAAAHARLMQAARW